MRKNAKLILLGVLGWLLTAACAFGQEATISAQVVSGFGTPAANAPVRVCLISSTGIPCTPTTTIFSDPGLTMPLPNPTTTDSNGNYSIFVPLGQVYLVQVSVQPNLTYSYLYSFAGIGSVSSVTVVTANGVSATVANQGTNPALTFSLGAINPLSVGQSFQGPGSFTSLTATGLTPGNCVQVSTGGLFVTTGSPCGSSMGTSWGTITSGMNTGATMICGTGCSLTPAGSGVITSTNSGSSTTATNLAGGALGSVPFQSAAGTTMFVPGATLAGHTFVLTESPTGSLIAPYFMDLSLLLASPPPIGDTTPNTGFFSALTDTSLFSGNCVQASTGGLLITVPLPCGGVESVSVVTANGVSGTVASPNVNPAITLTLGAITPSSIISSGVIESSNAVTTIAGSFVANDSSVGGQSIAMSEVGSASPVASWPDHAGVIESGNNGGSGAPMVLDAFGVGMGGVFQVNRVTVAGWGSDGFEGSPIGLTTPAAGNFTNLASNTLAVVNSNTSETVGINSTNTSFTGVEIENLTTTQSGMLAVVGSSSPVATWPSGSTVLQSGLLGSGAPLVLDANGPTMAGVFQVNQVNVGSWGPSGLTALGTITTTGQPVTVEADDQSVGGQKIQMIQNGATPEVDTWPAHSGVIESGAAGGSGAPLVLDAFGSSSFVILQINRVNSAILNTSGFSWNAGSSIPSSSDVCQISGTNCPLLSPISVTISSATVPTGSCVVSNITYSGLTNAMELVATPLNPPSSWIFIPSFVGSGIGAITSCNFGAPLALTGVTVNVVAIDN